MKNRNRMKVVALAWSAYVLTVAFVLVPATLIDPTHPANTPAWVGFCLLGLAMLVWSEWQRKKYEAGLLRCPECGIALTRVRHMETHTMSFGWCEGCKRVYKYEKRPT